MSTGGWDARLKMCPPVENLKSYASLLHGHQPVWFIQMNESFPMSKPDLMALTLLYVTTL